jgi:hypothetical protein
VPTTEFIFRYRSASITDHSYRTRPPVNINLSITHSTSGTTKVPEPRNHGERQAPRTLNAADEDVHPGMAMYKYAARELPVGQ